MEGKQEKEGGERTGCPALNLTETDKNLALDIPYDKGGKPTLTMNQCEAWVRLWRIVSTKVSFTTDLRQPLRLRTFIPSHMGL